MQNELLNRVKAISTKIQGVAKTAYPIRVFPHIGGDTMRAQANGTNKSIDLTARLIDTLNDSELAYVIAHEVAHFANKDWKRMADAMGQHNGLAHDAYHEMFKDRKAGLFQKTLSILGFMAFDIATSHVTKAQVSQGHETDADDLAMVLVQKAGYDPRKAVSALAALYGGHLPDPDLLNRVLTTITSSHPTARKRVERMKKNLQ
ncbi:MAG: M48 family metalloprotease [Candidatus Pacebacteria bacterium]|nr:M48 family metalloprotease [Candidatus Paceibacterota bacterium]